jgi:predicted nucleic acid-binding protein
VLQSGIAQIAASDIICDMRLVLDCDVLFSGLRSTVGASRILLLAIEARVVVPLVSVAMVIEYEAVLKRADNLLACGLVAADVDRFLDAFIAHSDHIVSYFRIRPAIQDPNDEMFAEAAINGQAEALVSFNLRDYQPADPGGAGRFDIPVCRPGDIVRRLSWRPSATSHFGYRPP